MKPADRSLAGERALLACALVFVPSEAFAIRWTLGIATELTPLVVQADRDTKPTFRLGFRPVLEFEPVRWLSLEAYAPFVVYRAGEDTGGGAASSGAESVFGLALAGRYPWIRDEAPEEILWYARVRGGFGTISGEAGPFAGGAIGSALTWLDTGRGFFVEATFAWVDVADVSRFTAGLTIGLVFRLGGEEWQIDRRVPIEARSSD
jgi:hypothetical protein